MITEDQSIMLSELIEIACIAREGMIQACYKGDLASSINMKVKTQETLDNYIKQLTISTTS